MEKAELIELISTILDEREERNFDPMGKLDSDNQDKLAKAFSLMQGEYESVIPNRINPHFRSNYADLDEALKSVRPLLKKYGFSLSQKIEFHRDRNRYLRTVLKHDSGQYTSSFDLLTQDKPGLQGYGAGLSYHKRYNACSLLGITVSNDPDDNDAEPRKNSNSNTQQKSYSQKGDAPKNKILLSKNEIEFINANLEGHDKIKNDLYRTLKIENLENCPKSLFDTIIMFIDAKKEKSSNKS